MINYPQIDPVIFSIGPLSVRWYGLMYVLGFLASYILIKKDLKKDNPDYENDVDFLDNLITWVVVGVVVGGRLGYVIFYNPAYYLRHPLDIFATWDGGMAFHGGALGAITAGYIYSQIKKMDFWEWIDRCVVTVPIGLGFGRIGNFINGELYGRATDVPWAMIFPQGGMIPRHPSQLYEAFLEGFLLFVILWGLKRKKLPKGSMLAFFIIFYSFFRFIVEFFREPDAHLGFVFAFLSMGQMLSIAFMIMGMGLFYVRSGKKDLNNLR